MTFCSVLSARTGSSTAVRPARSGDQERDVSRRVVRWDSEMGKRIDGVLPSRCYSEALFPLAFSSFWRSQFDMLSRTSGANSFGRVAYSLMLPVSAFMNK
jgi:hypothetical protein